VGKVVSRFSAAVSDVCVYLCWDRSLAVSPGVGFTVMAPSLAPLLCHAVPKLCMVVSLKAEVWGLVAAGVLSVRLSTWS